MSLRYLLDTNVLSEPLRPAPNHRAMARLHDAQGALAIASVVWHELWYGCLRMPQSARRASIERYLREVVAANVPILVYNDRAADWHARERARLEAAGRRPPYADGQIAAVAAINGLTLVTFNAADYSRFDGLRVEDWRAES